MNGEQLPSSSAYRLLSFCTAADGVWWLVVVERATDMACVDSNLIPICSLHIIFFCTNADDVWRLAVVERATNVACVDSERAARILACFTYSKMQVVSGLVCAAMV